MPFSTTLKPAYSRFRLHWRRLFAAAIAHRVLAFVVLTPLVAGLFGFFVSSFSSEIVADEDIATFFISPAGLLCLFVVGSLWLGIRALEVSTLVVILAAPAASPIRSIEAIRLSLLQSSHILTVAFRFLVVIFASVAPILVLAYVVYSSLLTEFDINYYLSHRPPEFIWALVAAVPLALGAVGLCLYFLSKWLFSIPIIMLEHSKSGEAMKRSAVRSLGRRLSLIGWHATWFALTALFSSVSTLLLLWLVHALMPLAGNSLWMLTLISGLGFLIGTIVSTIAELIAATGLAAIAFQLYLNSVDGASAAVEPPSADDEKAWPSIKIGSHVWILRPTWPRLVALATVGVLAAATLGAIALTTVEVPDTVLIMAHRGASLEAPENTLAAMKAAIQAEAHWVEIDVQLTADDEVVVAHDKDLMRLANRDLKIYSSTLSQLREVDVGSWFSPEFKEERIPTLREVLQLCKDRVGVNIELKPNKEKPGLEEGVVRVVEEMGMISQVVVMSLNGGAVVKTKKLQPELKVGMLLSVSATRPENIRADFLAVNASFVDRRLIQSAHAVGKDVYVWTVNDAATMSMMISRGVDALITDDPVLAKSVLRQRAAMTPAERLLAALAMQMGVDPQVNEQ